MSDQQGDQDSQEIHYTPQVSQEAVPMDVDTRVELLTNRFFFHELLKESPLTKHYIVEDIEVDPMTLNDPEAPLFYYLKQLKFKQRAEYNFARKYYMKIYNYCKMPFAKSDIVRLNFIYEFSNESDQYYELVLIYDYGEADRIDVDNISAAHINKFLKNVCLLLGDLVKYDEIYHGNVSLKNIILVNNELKLSGFKSRFLDTNSVVSWKIDLAREYGVARLDLFLIGLLWLVFLDVDVDTQVSSQMTIDDVKMNIRRVIVEIPKDKRMEIVIKLLDLDNHSGLLLDEVILAFDEQYILENIKTDNSPVYANNQDDIQSLNDNFGGAFTSYRSLKKNLSKDTNLFMKPYRESERDIVNFKTDEEQTARLNVSLQQEDVINCDGINFTLRDDNSMNLVRRNSDDIITIKDINGSLPVAEGEIHIRDHSGYVEDHNMANEQTYNKNHRQLLPSNRHSSEKQLVRKIDERNEQAGLAIRKLKSNAVLHPNNRLYNLNEEVQETDNIDALKIEMKQSVDMLEGCEIANAYSNPNLELLSITKNNRRESEVQKYNSIVENRYNTEENSEEEEESYRSFRLEDKNFSVDGIQEVPEEVLNEQNSVESSSLKIEEDPRLEDKYVDITENINLYEPVDMDPQIDEHDWDLQDYRPELLDNNKSLVDRPLDFSTPLKESIDEERRELAVSKTLNSELLHGINISVDVEAQKNYQIHSSSIDYKVLTSNLLSEQPNLHENVFKDSIDNSSANKELNLKDSTIKGSELKDSLLKESGLSSVVRKSNMRTVVRNGRDVHLSHLTSEEKVNFFRKQGDSIGLSGVVKSMEEKPNHNKPSTPRWTKIQEEEAEQKRLKNNFRDEGVVAPKDDWEQQMLNEREARVRAMRLEEEIQEEAERQKRCYDEKKRLEREALFVKEAERIRRDEELKAKIEKRLQVKIDGKKKQKRSVSRNIINNEKSVVKRTDRKIEVKNDDLENFISEKRETRTPKANDILFKPKTIEKESDVTRQYISLKRGTISVEKSDNKPSLEDIDRKIKLKMQLSSPLARQNMFYLKEDQIRDKSFKKVLLKQKSGDSSSNQKEVNYFSATVRVPFQSNHSPSKFDSLIKKYTTNTDPSGNTANLDDRAETLINKIDMSSQKRQGISEQQTKLDFLLRQVQDKSPVNEEEKIRENSSKDTIKKRVRNPDLSPERGDVNDQQVSKLKRRRSSNRSQMDESSLSHILDRSYVNVDKRRPSNKTRDMRPNKKHDQDRSIISAIDNKNAESDSFINFDKNSDEFDRKISEMQSKIDNKNYEESLNELGAILGKVSGTNKVTVFKMIATIYFKLRDHRNCIGNLQRCVEYINVTDNIESKVEVKQGVLVKLSISFIEIKRYDDALATLNDSVFADKTKLPFAYYSLVGDSYRELGRTEEAYTAYENQLKYFRTKQIDSKTIKSLFLLINKIIITLNIVNDDVRLVQFYRFILQFAEGLVNVDSTYKNTDQKGYLVKEHIVLTILNTLMLKGNYGIANYILNDLASNKILDYEKLHDEEKMQFVDTFIEFVNYLKEFPDYGGQKDCYIKYLIHTRAIMKNCEASEALSRKKLLIRFQEGTYYLNAREYPKAKRSFGDALKIYNSHIVEPDNELFAMLFNIAVSLFNADQFNDSIFFFEKILSLKCTEAYVRNKSIRMLSKAYYRVGEFQKGYNLLAGWIIKDMDAEDKKARNFYKYVSLYYLCASFTRFADVDGILQKLRDKCDSGYNAETVHYFNIYFNLTYLSARNKNYKQNDELVTKMTDMIKQKSKKNFGKEFVDAMCLIYNNYVLNKNETVLKTENFLMSLYKADAATDDNVNGMIIFLLNFMLTAMSRLPINAEKGPDEKIRNFFLDNASKLKSNVSLHNYILDVVTNAIQKIGGVEKLAEIPRIDVKDQKPDTIVLEGVITANYNSRHRASNINKVVDISKVDPKSRTEIMPVSSRISQKINQSESLIRTSVRRHSITKSVKSSVTRKFKKISSDVCLVMSNLKEPENCLCHEYRQENKELDNIIQEAYQNLTNDIINKQVINFSDLIANIDGELKSKKLEWDKYIYIKKIISFHMSQGTQVVERDNFIELLNLLINDLPLCIHDYQMMICLFEAFRDKDYIEILLTYLDKTHPNLIKLMLNQLFLQDFEDMYYKLKSSLFDHINNTSTSALINNPFINIINSEGKLKLDKEYDQNVEKRIRHTVLDDKALSTIFLKYVDQVHIDVFYLHYAVYNAIGDILVRKTDELQTITSLNAAITKLITNSISIGDCEFFMYDVLLLVSLLKFPKSDAKPLSKIVLETLNLVKTGTGDKMAYHISLVASLIGNILFTHRVTDIAVKAKMIALDSMKKLTSDEITFPDFYKPSDIKSLVFNILSVLFVDCFASNNKDQIEKYYKKVVNMPVDKPSMKLEQALLEVLYFVNIKDFEAVRTKLLRIQTLLVELGSDNFEADLYNCIVDKVSLDSSVATGKYGDIARKKDRFKKSFKQLSKRLG